MVIKPSKMSAKKQDNRNYWMSVVSQLENSFKQPKSVSEGISTVLPGPVYQDVCRTLELPPVEGAVTDFDDLKRRKKSSRPQSRQSIKMPLISYRKSFTVERDLESDTDVEISPRATKDVSGDVLHREFLSRGVRDQVTWPSRYLEPEREDEKSLVKKANDLTNKIAKEFCDYMRELGGTQPSPLFTPEAIKALFQVEFDTHATRSLRIVSRELGVVPKAVAEVTNTLEKSEEYILRRLMASDAKAEQARERASALARSLPPCEQRRAPRRSPRRLWRCAGHVPRDLVTLKAVWDGITNLRSVKEYCRWMVQHPELRRPPFLKSMGMFDLSTLDARITVESARSPKPSMTQSTEQ